MAGDELAHELEYSKPGSPPALVLHDGQVFCFDELATGAQPFEGVERRKLYTLEPVLDASNAEWVPALVPEDQAEAVREAAAQRIAELDRMNLTLAGVVDDLKKQRDERFDCKGGPGTTTPACGGCATCLHRVIAGAEAERDALRAQVNAARKVAQQGIGPGYADGIALGVLRALEIEAGK